MNTVTFEIANRDKVNQRVALAEQGIPQGEFISFENLNQMWKILSPKRWAILQLMAGAGPLPIREIARRAKRDVRAVHSDISMLILVGIVSKSEQGVEFPYNSIHVDFVLSAA